MTKKITALFMAVLMLLSLAACGDNSTDETTTEVPSTTSYIREIKTNIAAVNDVAGFGLSKLAKDRDYAYTVNFYDDVQQVKELIRNGKADVAAMNINDAVALYNEGADIKIIAVNNLASMYVVAKGVAISTLSDLKKHTIYTLKADDVNESFLKTLFADNGIDYKSLDIQTMADINEISSAIADKSEYVLMLEGVYAAKLPEDEERKTVIDMTAGWINQKSSLPVHSVVVAKTDYINSNPELIDEFRMFNEVSVNFIINNAEAGALHFYEEGVFENGESAMAYISSYCSLGYAEKEKMKTVIAESVEAYVEGELPAEAYYID